jgi:hypothetical protein
MSAPGQQQPRAYAVLSDDVNKLTANTERVVAAKPVPEKGCARRSCAVVRPECGAGFAEGRSGCHGARSFRAPPWRRSALSATGRPAATRSAVAVSVSSMRSKAATSSGASAAITSR